MRHLIFIAFLVFGINASAQIENIDEIGIMGEWNVVNSDGCFYGKLPIYNNEYKRPISFTFNDNDNTIVGWEFADGNPSYSRYAGYWITHNSDRYILHILANVDYDGYTGPSLLNFVITRFGNDEMTLQTLTGDGNLYLNKNTSANIQNAHNTKSENNKIYSVNGIELSEPVKGINIQSGKKFIKK